MRRALRQHWTVWTRTEAASRDPNWRGGSDSNEFISARNRFATIFFPIAYRSILKG
jgi:hypothetical protein